jgi:hypothetical protein
MHEMPRIVASFSREAVGMGPYERSPIANLIVITVQVN